MSTKERKALGRGFGALLKASEDSVAVESPASVPQILIDEIGFNPKQPRHSLDAEKLEELAQSIRTKGVIQPILVRMKDNAGKRYELIAGERRLRASKLAGFDRIPAVIKPIKDDELLEIALIENIQRDNLNPIEESRAYRDLLEEHGYTQENLAKRVGKNRSTIANFIRLLQLPEKIQQDVAAAKLTTGHARALLALDNEASQMQIRDLILENSLSVRETEDSVRSLKDPKPVRSAPKPVETSSQMTLNQDRLREKLGTKVIIKSDGKKGKIEIEFYSEEDFNRLFTQLLN